jgi:membrane associated rhomboid family serine protease
MALALLLRVVVGLEGALFALMGATLVECLSMRIWWGIPAVLLVFAWAVDKFAAEQGRAIDAAGRA